MTCHNEKWENGTENRDFSELNKPSDPTAVLDRRAISAVFWWLVSSPRRDVHAIAIFSMAASGDQSAADLRPTSAQATETDDVDSPESPCWLACIPACSHSWLGYSVPRPGRLPEVLISGSRASTEPFRWDWGGGGLPFRQLPRLRNVNTGLAIRSLDLGSARKQPKA